MRDTPLGFLITFTTYGTWLHGRDPGSVDREHNQPGEPFEPPSPLREDENARQLEGDPVLLDGAMRSEVTEAIAEACAYRGWKLQAINVRTNHVHVVAQADEAPERAMNLFKARATRRLREAGLMDADSKVWTRHGSTRWLWDLEGIAAAVHYVENEQ